jgi:hypothetical protein
MDLYANQSMEKESSSPLDEFEEFLIELWDMLKQDFRNSINFISSNKSFFTTAALLAILLKLSSVSNLGASFKKYCGGRGMRGGGGDPQVLSYPEYKKQKAKDKIDKQEKKVKAEREARIQQEIDKKAGALADKMMVQDTKKMEADRKKGINTANGPKTKEQYQAEAENAIKKKAKGNEDAAALKKGKSASIANYKAGVQEARDQDKLMKANQERISFFEGIKKKFQSTLSPGALGGPLFGRLDLIFDSVKDIFYIVAIILTIAGVLSLPVLVFLIITYYVFKTMLSKFIIL